LALIKKRAQVSSQDQATIEPFGVAVASPGRSNDVRVEALSDGTSTASSHGHPSNTHHHSYIPNMNASAFTDLKSSSNLATP
jgi:hypothetical protein